MFNSNPKGPFTGSSNKCAVQRFFKVKLFIQLCHRSDRFSLEFIEPPVSTQWGCPSFRHLSGCRNGPVQFRISSRKVISNCASEEGWINPIILHNRYQQNPRLNSITLALITILISVSLNLTQSSTFTNLPQLFHSVLQNKDISVNFSLQSQLLSLFSHLLVLTEAWQCFPKTVLPVILSSSCLFSHVPHTYYGWVRCSSSLLPTASSLLLYFQNS